MNSVAARTEKEEGAGGSWASESIPMDIRRQLLDRDLKKLGGRPAAGRSGGSAQAPQKNGPTGHPKADAPAHDEHPG